MTVKVRWCDCANVAVRKDGSGWMCAWCWDHRTVEPQVAAGYPDPEHVRQREKFKKRHQRAKAAGIVVGPDGLPKDDRDSRKVLMRFSRITAAFMMEER